MNQRTGVSNNIPNQLDDVTEAMLLVNKTDAIATPNTLQGPRTRLAGHQKWIDTRITYRIDVSVMKDTTTCTRGESETFAEYRSPEGKSTRGDTRKQSHGRCHNHARIARKYAKL